MASVQVIFMARTNHCLQTFLIVDLWPAALSVRNRVGGEICLQWRYIHLQLDDGLLPRSVTKAGVNQVCPSAVVYYWPFKMPFRPGVTLKGCFRFVFDLKGRFHVCHVLLNVSSSGYEVTIRRFWKFLHMWNMKGDKIKNEKSQRGTFRVVDHLHTINQLIVKTRKYSKLLWFAFLAHVKTFDSVEQGIFELHTWTRMKQAYHKTPAKLLYKWHHRLHEDRQNQHWEGSKAGRYSITKTIYCMFGKCSQKAHLGS